VRRLLEYEQIREITLRLGRAEADRARRRSKGYIEVRPRPSFEDVPLETEWEEVFAAALEVRLPEPFDSDHRVTPRTVSMEEKSQLILTSLRSGSGVEFRRLLEPFHDKIHGVMTFLAGLELSRRRRVLLRQSGPFKELWIYRRDEDGTADDRNLEPASESAIHPGPAVAGQDGER
jgi:chromatin segregation and condensation protein Rec8/ScpA/Scc1 (kleisin family)